MKKKVIFYRCNVCGNVIVKLTDSGLTPQCCGRDMVELISGVEEATKEKHIPEYARYGDRVYVKVGSELHPSEKMHHIEWILLETDRGFQITHLDPLEAPKTVFSLEDGEKPIAVFAYCNLHKLWEAKFI